MAVVTTKSGPITNRDSSPTVKNLTTIEDGFIHESVGTVELANGDSIASKLIMHTVPSNCRISRLLLSCDAIAATGAADVGVYETTANGGAVVDVDFFASAVVLTAALVHSDITHEADAADAGAGYGLADVEKPLWQALGLSADPAKFYDIVYTLTAAAGGAGTVSSKVQFTL
jgi:hypothetical protein